MAGEDTISEVGRACLKLHLADGVGPIRFRRLLEHFGSAEAVLSASRRHLGCVQGVGTLVAGAIAAASRLDIEDQLDAARAVGARILAAEDPEYPRLLKHIADPPICLYVRGRLEPSDALALAVVGARRCTFYGREQAQHFAGCLARAGLTIVSGLARGIDGAAQAGALDAEGRTIGVLGCGLAHIYPPEHAELAERVAANGALLSEVPPDTPPDDQQFPRRNRIIAGLSLGVLVIEGTRGSGALITARQALDYNREVFAIPGRIDSPLSVAPNSLIRDQQAKLVIRMEDIIEELGEVGARLSVDLEQGTVGEPAATRRIPVALTETERKVLTGLQGRECTMDQIIEHAGLSAAEVASVLTHLQLKACVRLVHGNKYAPTGRPVE